MRYANGLLAMLLVGCSAGADESGPASDTSEPNAAGSNSGAGGSQSSGGGIAGSSASGGSSVSGGATGGGPIGASGGAIGSGGAGKGGSTGAGGSNVGGGSDAGAVSSKCSSPKGPGLPAGAPLLTPGTWKNLSPAGWPFGGAFTQGIAVDPCNPAVIYLSTSSFDPSQAGLFKTIDGGASWTKIGKLDEPIRVRIDPKNTQHLYAGDGVRGGTMGFFVSTDGGATWNMPKSFSDLQASQGLYAYDVYDVAVDPTDFNHVLLSFHGAWGWTETKWKANAGVLESKDGGDTWIIHAPKDGWGYGHSIHFLYDPDLGIGDAKTWLLGTQGPGQWRTTDAGETWTKVTDIGIQHGGGTIYYTKAGVLFATGGNQNLRSTDNGATWTTIGPGGGYNGIIGDGKQLYAAKCFGPTAIITSPETDGLTWKDFNSQQFNSGPFEMALDSVNGIVYSGSWGVGVLALKLGQ
jgi:hypothetical protein